jgi:hypothetical protein
MMTLLTFSTIQYRIDPDTYRMAFIHFGLFFVSVNNCLDQKVVFMLIRG